MASVGEWTGFSDQDLQKMRTQTDEVTSGVDLVIPAAFKESNPVVKSKKPRNKKSSLASGIAKPTITGKIRSAGSSTTIATESSAEQPSTPSKSAVTLMAETSAYESSSQRVKSITAIDDDPLVNTPSRRGRTAFNGTVTLRVKEDGRGVELVNDDGKQNDSHAEVDTVESVTRFENFVGCNDINARMTKKVSLEEFQLKQKMIEEQNKWRRAMLTKAIADRKRKTVAETEKLTHIQTELQKLDSLVSNDVAILRNQIEVASVEFNEIQKRYEKAEREFVEAKVDLFRKMERKEKLTEHLCKIIEENELRKAKKLSELMDELELESLRDDECLDDGEAVLPQLCAFNDITYAYCTTFRRPSSPLCSARSTEESTMSSGETVLVGSGDALPEVTYRVEEVENVPQRSDAETIAAEDENFRRKELSLSSHLH